jgi:hypothetical protein
VADHDTPTPVPPAFVAEEKGDSFSDDQGAAGSAARVDRPCPLDSDAKRIRTDIPERLDQLLPGESALVYHRLRERLATLFDEAR